MYAHAKMSIRRYRKYGGRALTTVNEITISLEFLLAFGFSSSGLVPGLVSLTRPRDDALVWCVLNWMHIRE